jgi:hypothetical protein
MRKFTLLILTGLFCAAASGQQNYWTSRISGSGITTDKAVARLAYPKEFRLFDLNVDPLKDKLFTITDKPGQSTIIYLPDADGRIEQFEVFEASNFDPDLQAAYPLIRAFSGRGITDRYAILKLSISLQGIQTMVFRTGKENEFIEPYSRDHTIYSVYRSQRDKSKLPWICSTVDQQLATDLNAKVYKINTPESNAGQIKTLRLAQSCNGEYSNFFGAFNASQSALVYATFNATLTRCNGCYEKDLAVHLNLISNTFEDQIIFYDPATDPYTTLSNWNGQLQNLLNTVVGNGNYDIGHMFGASGGGGNAGCIGCVCVDGQKGSGITSPADNIPMGDNFDIDYVVHEVGHQLGGEHTFSYSNEGPGPAQKEVGAGITIMGYAGITNFDPAPHSIDIYHAISIQQIQTNLAGKTCPVTVNMTVNHPPVVQPVSNYTIPISTPFALTGSATDPENDPITYCWEENDNLVSGGTGSNSVAFATKAAGPNWLSFPATVSGTRLCPRLSTILAGLLITPPFPGGDAICNIEALSSVSRNLNFRLTVRDNRPYVPGSTIGQTQFTDMVVSVTNTSGPFMITSPNTNVSWLGNSAQTITWNVAGTTGVPVSCANVRISLSTDGGQTFPTVLLASTPNDGSESITIPNIPTATARIKIEAVGNIFFDISDANFTILASTSGFTFNSPPPVTSSCPAPASMQTTLTASFFGGFANPVTLTASGNPSGTTVVFGTNPLTPGSPSSTITLTGTSSLFTGSYIITVTGTANGATTQIRNLTYTINPGAGPAITTQPVSQSVCTSNNITFSVVATGASGYQWQKSTDGGLNWIFIAGATGASYTITNVQLTDAAQYRSVVTGQCGSTNSNAATLTVRQMPTVTLTASLTSLLPGHITTLTATPSLSTGGLLTTSWLYNGTAPVPPITLNTYIADVEHVGTYQVLIQEVFPGGLVCANQSAVVTITATPSDKLFIYPSPNDGRFTVSYFNNSGASTSRTITIFDSEGRLVYQAKFNITGAYTLLPIDLKTHSSGIDLVVVGDPYGKKLATGKVHVR